MLSVSGHGCALPAIPDCCCQEQESADLSIIPSKTLDACLRRHDVNIDAFARPLRYSCEGRFPAAFRPSASNTLEASRRWHKASLDFNPQLHVTPAEAGVQCLLYLAQYLSGGKIPPEKHKNSTQKNGCSLQTAPTCCQFSGPIPGPQDWLRRYSTLRIPNWPLRLPLGA